MKTVKNPLASLTLSCLLAISAAAQDPGTMGTGGDKTQPPPPPPPSTQTASTGIGVTGEYEEDEGIFADIWNWLGFGDADEAGQ